MDENIKNISGSGSWMSPEVYLDEYKKYSSVLTTGSCSYLFSYLFLHLYFENLFHHHLRMMVDGSTMFFRKPSRFNPKDSPLKKLETFKVLLDSAQIKYNPNYFRDISSNYRKISEIRNLLVHGYPIEKMEINGEETLSNAMEYFEPKAFASILQNANSIVESWNGLLKEVRGQKDKIVIAELDYSEFFTAEIPHRFKITE